ncbi:putative polysaccharide biosynthesis protein [Pseudomonas synxantha BG33R]|uniref:oligosaccharide flippase family protein n=1 Tax=Pseudomonas TaxID=286 RepID=UPI00025FE2C0|nr:MULTISPECIES: oligosaccharide flippase family protein [Pseudomonas]EIK68559.1 putative polysaccharide biosynthesis protein [Pseudomonas synxantha BG33R]QOY73275.1 oligosaccharide flippase family protein [Pseudomonas sp. OST1909]
MFTVFKNMSLLFVVQLFGYLVPILEIPVLARSLGVQEYGKVVLVQSIALLSSLVVEYGFSLSAARQVSLAKTDVTVLSRVFGEVLSAKLIISSVISIAALCFYMFINSQTFELEVIGLGFLYFIAFGFSPFWFFQGLEKIALVVFLEVGLRVASLICLFIFVHDPGDALVALSILATFALANTVLGNYLCYRNGCRVRFSLSGGWLQICKGFHVFIYKSSNNILLSAGPALVGLLCGKVAVSGYVPAEKIIRGFVGFINPVLIGFFPYLNRQYLSSAKSASRLSWIIVGLMFLLGCVSALSISVAGGFLINKLLGADFEQATTTLQIFVWIIPFRMTNQALGLCMLIPRGMDKVASSAMLLFSVVSILLASLLSINYYVNGIVLGFILAEVMLCVTFLVLSYRYKPVTYLEGRTE